MVSRLFNTLAPDEIMTNDIRKGRIVSADREILAIKRAENYGFGTAKELTTWLKSK